MKKNGKVTLYRSQNLDLAVPRSWTHNRAQKCTSNLYVEGKCMLITAIEAGGKREQHFPLESANLE